MAIVGRVLALDEGQVADLLKQVVESFGPKHRAIGDILSSHFERVSHLVSGAAALSDARKMLIGAYFTMEYSLESAALFNPSMVSAWDPDWPFGGKHALYDEPAGDRGGTRFVDRVPAGSD